MSPTTFVSRVRITFSACPFCHCFARPDCPVSILSCSEETSNNRVRSGVNPRPIDFVPGAGARKGTADGVETTDAPLGVVDTDVEQGEGPPTSPMLLPPTPTTARPPGLTPTTPTTDASIPHLQV